MSQVTSVRLPTILCNYVCLLVALTDTDIKQFSLNKIVLSKIFTLVVDCIGNQINQRQLDKSSLVGNLDLAPPSPLLPDPTE